ncbi:MAG: hypothetical protein AAF434_15485 [Pseudomonadota bacterium]
MKICIWTTSLQADTLALALALDRDPEVELMIVAANLNAYRNEPVARLCPLSCELIDRHDDAHEKQVVAFGADIVIADNHLPKFKAGQRLVFLWHGLPLKTQPKRDIKSFHRRTRRLVGDARRPNAQFLAQCYGEIDYRHRIDHWRIDESNCRVWGSAFSDLLLDPPYTRESLSDYYGLDVAARKNVLLSLTWNFGDKAFGVVGDDEKIFEGLFQTAAAEDANVIFSLHDRFRYHPSFVKKIEDYARAFPHSSLKFKNEHADNLSDLIVSDVMICNFSSFITFHYFTGKPSIHIKPFEKNNLFVNLPTLRGGGLKSVFRLNNKKLWIYPFEDNGGVMPLDYDELMSDLKYALADQSYASEQAKSFISRRIYKPDGASCNRIIADLKQWLE